MSDALVSLKCPSCSGNVPYNDGDIACECPYCATQFLIKDALKARSIDHLATAIEKTAKPSFYEIEVQKAALNFARVWNNGNCNLFEANNALDRLITLDNSDETEQIKAKMSEIVALYRDMQERSNLASFVRRITPTLLGIAGAGTLVCFALLHNTLGGILFLTFGAIWLLAYLISLVGVSRQTSSQEKVYEAQKFVTNSVNSILNRFRK